MNDESYLRTSFLISEITKILCPDDPNALSQAVDVLQNYSNSAQRQYNINTFQFRWMMQLDKNDKREQKPALIRDMNILAKNLSNPNSIFYLLDEIKNYSAFQAELPHLFQNPTLLPINNYNINLPDDFIPVLQGIDGANFKYSMAQKRFIYRIPASPYLYNAILNVGMIGCVIKTLNNYIESTSFKSDGISCQYAATVVRSMLNKHMLFVSNLEQKFHTLSCQQLLSLLLTPEIEKLKATAIICSTISHKKGCELFNTLHIFISHGNKNISEVASEMEQKCFEFINSLVRTWITQGRVSDPFSEFFVQCNESIRLCSEWWNNRFSLINKEQLPMTLSQETIMSIFNSGKTLNFLRQWDEPVVLSIDQSLPFDEFVQTSSKETTELMLNLMFKKHNLLQSLQDIHDFVLLQRGDYVSSLLEIDYGSISRRISYIINTFSHHIIREIDFKIKNNDWELEYQALAPLSAVFGTTELNVYKAVSLILLRLKRIEHALIHADRSTRQMSLVFYEMLHFIRIIQSFFNLHIIQASYKHLLEVLEHPSSFDEVLKEHKDHTTKIARGLWVTQSGAQCKNALFKILENIDFAVKSPAELFENYNLFKSHVQEFYNTIFRQKPTGKELGRILLLSFRFIDVNQAKAEALAQEQQMLQQQQQQKIQQQQLHQLQQQQLQQQQERAQRRQQPYPKKNRTNSIF